MDVLRFLDICEVIGGLVECNANFTDGLVRMFEGRTIEDLTVGELIAAIKVRSEQYNQMHGGEHG